MHEQCLGSKASVLLRFDGWRRGIGRNAGCGCISQSSALDRVPGMFCLAASVRVRASATSSAVAGACLLLFGGFGKRLLCCPALPWIKSSGCQLSFHFSSVPAGRTSRVVSSTPRLKCSRLALYWCWASRYGRSGRGAFILCNGPVSPHFRCISFRSCVSLLYSCISFFKLSKSSHRLQYPLCANLSETIPQILEVAATAAYVQFIHTEVLAMFCRRVVFRT